MDEVNDLTTDHVGWFRASLMVPVKYRADADDHKTTYAAWQTNLGNFLKERVCSARRPVTRKLVGKMSQPSTVCVTSEAELASARPQR